jgi:hypothetical protein
MKVLSTVKIGADPVITSKNAEVTALKLFLIQL